MLQFDLLLPRRAIEVVRTYAVTAQTVLLAVFLLAVTNHFCFNQTVLSSRRRQRVPCRADNVCGSLRGS